MHKDKYPTNPILMMAGYVLSFMFVFNVAFGNAFMQIVVLWAPINEILIFFMLGILASSGLLRIPTRTTNYLYLWLGVNLLIYLPIGLSKYGIVAGRDATQVLDATILILTYSVICRIHDYRIFERVLLLALTLEFLDRIVFFQFNTLSINTFQSVSFFGGTIGSSVIIMASFWFGVIMKTSKSGYMIIASVALILLHQNRFLYLSMIITGIMYFVITNRSVFNKTLIKRFGIFIIALYALESLISVFGNSDSLYLSSTRLFKYGAQSLSFSGIFEQLATGIGVESEVYVGSAGGLLQRVGWWSAIILEMVSDSSTLLFGMGYGIPLTDSVAITVIREPHNSFISVFARNGLLLSTVWLGFHILFFWRGIRMLSKEMAHTMEYKILLVCLLTLLSIYVTALVEPAFELPPIAIPAYMLLAISILMVSRLKSLKLKDRHSK